MEVPSCVGGCIGGCGGSVFWPQRERERPGNISSTRPCVSWQQHHFEVTRRQSCQGNRGEWQLWGKVWVRRPSQPPLNRSPVSPLPVSPKSYLPFFTHSLNKHILKFCNDLVTVLDAGDTLMNKINKVPSRGCPLVSHPVFLSLLALLWCLVMPTPFIPSKTQGGPRPMRKPIEIPLLIDLQRRLLMFCTRTFLSPQKHTQTTFPSQ